MRPPAAAPPAAAPPPAAPAPAPTPAGAAKAPSTPTLRGEADIILEAQKALREGRVEQALALLERHDADYRQGALREERLVVRVLALCKAGRPAAARKEASAFLSAFPRSPHAPRVRGACEGP